ncbi:MAG: IclR family transcriptional regulator domain-containing protein [Beijerinckiaceae bacterium]
MDAKDLELKRSDWIAGLEKGLGILEAFDETHARLSAAQMGLRCGLTRTAARRHLLTLVHLGYVATDGKLFWLAPRVLKLGHAYISSSRMARIAQPFLQRIALGTAENAYLSTLVGDQITYIARHGDARQHPVGYVLGAMMPAHVTAAGCMLLALQDQEWLNDWQQRVELKSMSAHSITDKRVMRTQLQQFRHQDWSVSEQQLELGFRGIAVPVRDARGNVLAALSVTMLMGGESTEQATQRVLSVLRQAAVGMRDMI